MKFDAYIEEQYKALGLVTEEYQDSNVIADFFKKVKYAAKGGKPADSYRIVLKDRKFLGSIKSQGTNPTYAKASSTLEAAEKASAGIKAKLDADITAKNSALEAEKKKPTPDSTAIQNLTAEIEALNQQKADLSLNVIDKKRKKLNENIIAMNVYDILYAASLRGGDVGVDIYTLLSDTPKLKNTANSTHTSEAISDSLKKAGIDYNYTVQTVEKVVKPSVDKGWLKIENPREYSPKDLFNKLVNKIAGGVQQTAGEVWNNYDPIARM